MTLDENDIEAARAYAERLLTREEIDAYVNAPISDAEREEVLELSRWFMTRYPTAGERLAYVRRALLRPVRRAKE